MFPRFLPRTLLSLLLISVAPARAQQVDLGAHLTAARQYEAGEKLMSAGQFEQAASAFSTAVSLNPLLSIAHYELGRAYMALKRYDDAVRAFTACRDAFHQLRALAYSDDLQARRWATQEITALSDFIDHYRRTLETIYSIETQVRIERFERRINDIGWVKEGETIPDQTPAPVSMALGSAYFHAGALADAEREYLAAVAVDPNFGAAHNNLAVVYMLTNRLDEAGQALMRAEKAGFRVDPGLKTELASRRPGS